MKKPKVIYRHMVPAPGQPNMPVSANVSPDERAVRGLQAVNDEAKVEIFESDQGNLKIVMHREFKEEGLVFVSELFVRRSVGYALLLLLSRWATEGLPELKKKRQRKPKGEPCPPSS